MLFVLINGHCRMSPLDVLRIRNEWQATLLAHQPVLIELPALRIKIMPRGYYDHLTVLKMHVHWSFFYFAFIYFFQWICTKIGRAAKRPRGIWICSTWSEMYVFLRNIFKIWKWNTRISWQNTKWTYYTQRKVSHWSQILSSIFFSNLAFEELHCRRVTWCSSP